MMPAYPGVATDRKNFNTSDSGCVFPRWKEICIFSPTAHKSVFLPKYFLIKCGRQTSDNRQSTIGAGVGHSAL